MNISELDEAQGLTAEMVRDFLRGRGFECEDGWKWKHRDAPRRLVYADLQSAPLNSEITLRALRMHGEFQSAQEMLRLINPRLQKGVPSLAARRAHCRNGGMWIGAVGDLGLGGSMLFVSFMDPELDTDDGMAVWTAEEWCNYASANDLERKCADWKFWPVDLHGNKVRWPVGPEGML